MMRTYLLLLAFVANYCFAQNWALRYTIDNEPFHEGLAAFHDKDSHLHGFMNASGEIVISAKYEYVDNFNAGTAVVTTTEGKKGIIDKYDHFILQPIYKYISLVNKVPGMYKVTSDEDRHGLFYNGRLVLPVEYKYIFTYSYPFINYQSQDGISQDLNIITGEVFDYVCQYGPMYLATKNGVEYYYDQNTGERIDTSSIQKASSKGIVAFQDQTTKLYGFKNQRTGEVSIQPKYLTPWRNFWINDAMIVRIDSLSKVNPKKSVLIDCYGKEHDLCVSKEELLSFVGDYVMVSDLQDRKDRLYTNKGEFLFPTEETRFSVMNGETDWFVTLSEPWLIFDAKNKATYPGMTLGRFEDMFAVQNGSCSYYINANTRKRIEGDYYEVNNFSDGLGRVKFSNDFYDIGFVDKKGNTVLRGGKKIHITDDFSEGVVGAYNNSDDYKDCFNGYIYNPLGHGDYSYKASDKMAVNETTLNQWKRIADEAFEKKQYGKAKEHYYRIMMNKPDEAEAILNYGACLNNLGYYDEAIECYELALDIDPSYELARKNLEIVLNNKRVQESNNGQEVQSQKSNTFWDALSNFANILGNMSGATNMYQSYSSFSSGNGGLSPGGAAGGNYQSQYDMWARRAESHYNSLTNLGYSATSKNGNKSGGTLQSMSGSNYVQMKKSLRDAQREMQRIRRTAANNGVTIQQSRWETATVRY